MWLASVALRVMRNRSADVVMGVDALRNDRRGTSAAPVQHRQCSSCITESGPGRAGTTATWFNSAELGAAEIVRRITVISREIAGVAARDEFVSQLVLQPTECRSRCSAARIGTSRTGAGSSCGRLRHKGGAAQDPSRRDQPRALGACLVDVPGQPVRRGQRQRCTDSRAGGVAAGGVGPRDAMGGVGPRDAIGCALS